MTLLATDGFETYASVNDMASRWTNRTVYWAGQYGSAALAFVGGRFNYGQCVRMTDFGGGSYGSWGVTVSTDYALSADYPVIITGFAMNIASLYTPSVAFMTLLDNTGTNNIDFRVNSSPAAYLTRANGASVLCTSLRNLILGNWTYIEVATNISATAGWAELWQDGILQASYYGSGTGRANANGNTQGGLASVRAVRLGFACGGNGNANSGGNTDVYYDDFYICSGTGARNNNVLGDCRVSTLLPTGPSADGTGAHTQFTLGGTTPSATNWQSVDEANYNQDVDYVQDNVIGHQDTYKYPALPTNAATIYGVVAQHVARKDDAGMRQLSAVVRQNSADALSPSAAVLTGSYVSTGLVMEVNPTTGALWLPSDVNAAEYGFRVTA
jgi:hypothetical protein